jgi:hydroxymethylpyrimidine kinase/phosphomethylpyrimidine kinase
MSSTIDRQPVVLSIAGSDPSGGAGIQADLKTFASLGVYGGAVISSLTAQNTLGVSSVRPVDPAFVKEQIDSVLADLNVSHIKIGMLGSGDVALSVIRSLADFSGEIIYDPVLISSGGARLLDRDGHDVVSTQLLGICTVITPNVVELSQLTANDCADRDSLLKAGRMLLLRFKKLRSVIITGGHLYPEGKAISDFLLTVTTSTGQAEYEEATHPRIDSPNTHGTGCTFSAAFTAFHLLTGDDRKAFVRSAAYMDNLVKLSASATIGHGTGPLAHHLYKE